MQSAEPLSRRRSTRIRPSSRHLPAAPEILPVVTLRRARLGESSRALRRSSRAGAEPPPDPDEGDTPQRVTAVAALLPQGRRLVMSPSTRRSGARTRPTRCGPTVPMELLDDEKKSRGSAGDVLGRAATPPEGDQDPAGLHPDALRIAGQRIGSR